jgi:hypothetical protein
MKWAARLGEEAPARRGLASRRGDVVTLRHIALHLADIPLTDSGDHGTSTQLLSINGGRCRARWIGPGRWR